MSPLSYLPICLRSLLFVNLTVYLTNYQLSEPFLKISDINNASHAFYGTQSFKNLIQVIPRYFCKNW